MNRNKITGPEAPTSFTAERAENAERKVGSMRLQKQAMDPTVRDKRD